MEIIVTNVNHALKKRNKTLSFLPLETTTSGLTTYLRDANVFVSLTIACALTHQSHSLRWIRDMPVPCFEGVILDAVRVSQALAFDTLSGPAGTHY